MICGHGDESENISWPETTETNTCPKTRSTWEVAGRKLLHLDEALVMGKRQETGIETQKKKNKGNCKSNSDTNTSKMGTNYTK